ncbi:MAG TPA: SusC/RagA family protein [Marinilabiliales bacterium]|nr:MAG: SusC/RagA family protein [Bacteroidetes bacterium GWD2_40_43]OFX91517.1 MAG: SusC/RagA family protein [Bacteroidetes bacterium GWE2_40_63]OFY19679.1 MAG: SusC/RagA family protein [Bacteroidetes bacterium GWF2_40_13]OFZ25479.1 MAG: SusC/RagA family protein [Bacteroidetes bacterium RIFOXYC2_FULL_40_12]HAN00386.1 SusC/RagA family protein [Marinilabiliales bacterium]
MKYLYLILLGLLALASATYAQTGNITVNGKIVDNNGEPLPGASVIEKGTTNGTIANFDGNFTLSVHSDASLVVSFIGFKTIEVTLGGKTELGSITLDSDIMELDQVVVIGYGTQRKVDLTGSVAVVNTEEMKKVSHSNISTMLEGRVAGIQITTDGQPGADPTVRIRGIGSFGSTSPLYVIDGVPMGTTIRDFSPNDIESLQVLKDASAAAIYGSRAANGVVIITTKQGTKNKAMKIDYSGYFGMDQVQKGVYDVMDAQQYGKYVTMAYKNYENMGVPSGYNPLSPNYLYNADGTAKVNTDWFKEAFKTGIRQNHNINMSGGGANNTYNIGLDYFSQQGTMEGAGPNFDRYTARINNTMDVKFVKFKTNIVYSHSSQDNMALSNANEYVQGLYGSQYPVMASVLLLPPTIKAYDESTWVLDDKISAASEYTYDSYGFGTYYDDIHGDLRVTNVLLTNSLIQRNTTVDRIVSTGSAIVDLFDMVGQKNSNHKLDYNLNLSYSKTICKDFTFIPSFIQSTTNYLPKSNEILTEGYRNYSDALIENFVTYEGKFGRNHINAVVGQTFQHELFHTLTADGVTLAEPYYLQVGNTEETSGASEESEHIMASYIGRFNYNFDEKYLISLTARRDGSSRLSSDDRWDWFPSISAGWRIERESFFPEVAKSMINLLKVRGSYGELGSIENLTNYGYMDVMSRGNYTYSFGNNKVTGSAVSNYVNTSIRWEKKKSLDLGFDLAMFSNQFEFTFDYFKSTSEDVHYGVKVPANAGVTNTDVKMNASTIENSGLEFLIGYHNHKNPVKFDVTANLSTLKNKVIELDVLNKPQTDGYCRTEIGSEVGQFYGMVSEGIFRSQSEIDNNVNDEGALVTQEGAKEGDIRYKDVNNDGQITLEGDRTILGSGLAKIHYGLNLRAEWRGFDLSISTYGAAKFKAVDFVDLTLHSSYRTLNKSVDLLNAYNSETDAAVNGLPVNTNTDVPRIAYNSEYAITNDLFSQRFIQNASYFKIANIELGYNFPDNWFKGAVSSVRVYASAQNVATFTKYKGYNVDFAGGTYTPGYNYCSYPTPRTVMFGARFSF